MSRLRPIVPWFRLAPIFPPNLVYGPILGSSTDNAIVRWDGTTGAMLQDSVVSISDGPNAVFAPVTTDNAALCSTSLMWSDLFLASGSVINFNSGDVTLTHSANLLTLAGGDFTVSGALNVTGTTTLAAALTGPLRADSGVVSVDSTLVASTYIPTLTNVANLDGSTAYSCQYMRVGATVTVSGQVDIDPTVALASTQLGISLPVASNLANANECCGTAFASSIAGQGAAILGDAVNNRAQLQYIAGDVTNQAMYFSFTYRII